MKKLLICFSFLVLNSSFVFSQDTLFYNNGFKRAVKIVSVQSEITYTVPPDETRWQVPQSKINYIKYADGSTYKVNQTPEVSSPHYDSTLFHDERLFVPYILFSGGSSSPFPFGNGNNAYAVQDPETGNWSFNDAGYAKNGTLLSVTAGLVIYHGWEVTGMFNYIQNGMDATGYMNKVAYFGIDNLNSISSSVVPSFIPVTGVTTTGMYNYINQSILFGITKNWESERIRFGISILGGTLTTKLPAMNGIATYQSYNNQTGNTTTTNYYLYLSSEKLSNSAIEMNLHLDVKINQHIFIRGAVEIENSSYTSYCICQLVNMNNGSTFATNFYAGSNLDITLFNATAGIDYKF